MIKKSAIERVILQNMGDWDFTVERLAELLKISPSYLREIVGCHYGQSPHYLIKIRRMEKAVILLKNGQKFYNIGRTVGYNNMRTFRKAFAEVYGTSPSVYRARLEGTRIREANNVSFGAA